MSHHELDIDWLNKVADTAIVVEQRATYGSSGKGFRDLRVWQAGMDLVESCYRYSQDFPSTEQFGLTNQLRGAAVSITSNIAEGWGRNTRAEFARFVDISIGSLCEVESLVEVSKRLAYLGPDAVAELVERANRVGSMGYRLRNSLKRQGP